jgi:pimeloyl-ACP methyl ester carboxylesterase
MAVLFDRRRLGPAPALLVRQEELRLPLPTVLVFHGLSADKDVQRRELVTLAEAGFLAVGIDAAGHGERRLPDFEELFAGSREEIEPLLFSLVTETVAEVPAILDALAETGLADPERFALFGISMGAHITYGAILAEPRLRAAVALVGSPEWRHPGSPHRRPQDFFPVALLSITGEKDINVPPASARAFHRALEPHYRGSPERLRYLEIPDAPHLMSAEDWETAMREAVDWLTRFLGPPARVLHPPGQE